MDHQLRAVLRTGTDHQAALRARLRAGQLEPELSELLAALHSDTDDWARLLVRQGGSLAAQVGLAVAHTTVTECSPTQALTSVLESGHRQRLAGRQPQLQGAYTAGYRARRKLFLDASGSTEETRAWCVGSACLKAIELVGCGDLTLLHLSDALSFARQAFELTERDGDARLREITLAVVSAALAQPSRSQIDPRPRHGLAWEDIEWAQEPALVLGWSRGVSLEGAPRQVVTLTQQAGGYAILGYPQLTGLLLRCTPNLGRLGPRVGELLGGFEAMGEDPDWGVLSRRFGALRELVGTWDPYAAAQLSALSQWIGACAGWPPAVSGMEACVRLAEVDLRRFEGWRVTSSGPDGPEDGGALDRALLAELAAWGGRAGLAGRPAVWLVWRNCD